MHVSVFLLLAEHVQLGDSPSHRAIGNGYTLFSGVNDDTVILVAQLEFSFFVFILSLSVFFSYFFFT